MNIVRTLGIFMALAALSFVLGFFVLARLIPGSTKPTMATAMPANGVLPAAEPRDGTSRDSASAAPVAHPKKSPVVASVKGTAQHQKPVAPGPTLDPVNDAPSEAPPSGVQKPRKVKESVPDDNSSSNSGDSGDSTVKREGVDAPRPRVEPGAAAVVRPRHRRHAAVRKPEPALSENTADNGADANSGDGQDAPAPKPRRTRRVRPTVQEDERPAAAADQGDNELPTARTSRPARRRADPEAASGAMYHVHLGAFHSRNAAAHEVQRARDKGFSAQLVPVTHNGRTLYRVQAGAFHERTRAESVKQSLQDASLDASVVQQSH